MPKRNIALPSLVLNCGAVAFLAASLSTYYWVEAEPFKVTFENNETAVYRKGNINIGLFIGFKSVKNVDTALDSILNIVCRDSYCKYSDEETAEARIEDLEKGIANLLSNKTAKGEVFSQSIWASTVAFLSAAVLMGIIGAIFSVVNAVMNPVEFITSIRGLHIWNALGGTFGVIAMITWGLLYHNSLTFNLLSTSDLVGQWTSDGTAYYSFSFWLVFASILLYAANSLIILLQVHRPWEKKLPKTVEANSSPTGNILLY